jgi:predicted F0F1-ATPase subunit
MQGLAAGGDTLGWTEKETSHERRPHRRRRGRAEARDRAGKADPEPSLARRFGQIGVLGWMIVIPILVGVYAGSWLDHWLGTGILMSAHCFSWAPFWASGWRCAG